MSWLFTPLLESAELLSAPPPSLYIVQSADYAAGAPTNAISITLPSTPTVGNELLFAVGYLVNTTLSTPSGWTLIDDYHYNNVGVALFRRTVIGGDGTSWTPTVTSGSDYLGAAILEIAGGDLASATVNNNGTNGSSTHTSASLTPGSIPTLPIVFASQDDAAAAGSDNITAPAGWTVDERAFPDYHSLYAISKDALTTDTSTAINAAITGVGTGSDFGSTIILVPESGGGANYSETPSDTITFSDAAVKTVTKHPADTLTFSDTATKTTTSVRTAADTITFSDAAVRTISKAASDTINFSDAAAKSLTKYPADTLTFSDSPTLTRTFARAAADTLTFSDVATRAVGINKADTLTFSDSATPSTSSNQDYQRFPADTLTFSDVPTRVVAYVRMFADTLTFSDDVVAGIIFVPIGPGGSGSFTPNPEDDATAFTPNSTANDAFVPVATGTPSAFIPNPGSSSSFTPK